LQPEESSGDLVCVAVEPEVVWVEVELLVDVCETVELWVVVPASVVVEDCDLVVLCVSVVDGGTVADCVSVFVAVFVAVLLSVSTSVTLLVADVVCVLVALLVADVVCVLVVVCVSVADLVTVDGRLMHVLGIPPSAVVLLGPTVMEDPRMLAISLGTTDASGREALHRTSLHAEAPQVLQTFVKQ
jgi:hypothetical protein